MLLTTTCEKKFKNDKDDPNYNGGRKYLLDDVTNCVGQPNQSSDFGTIAIHKLRHIDSGDLSSWWCTNDENEDEDDGDDTVANDITLNQSDLSEKSEATNLVYRIRHIESGEKAWWMATDNSSKENSVTKNVVLDEPSVPKSENREWWLEIDNRTSTESEQSKQKCVAPPPPPPPVYRIRHIASGEKAWWMNDDSSEQENKSKLSSKNNSTSEKTPQWFHQSPTKDALGSESAKSVVSKYCIRHVESGEKAWWMQDEKSNHNELNNGNNCSAITVNQDYQQTTEIDKAPLGDRASPEGLEDTAHKDRISPSYNSKDHIKNLKKLFISRHTNIDDLLGGSSHSLSPLLLDCFESDEPFEKITPDQVRIHEGTVGPFERERLHANR